MNLYPFGKVVTYAFARCAFGMRYEGLEHIPETGGYILACNHLYNIDPVLIAHKIPLPVRYLAKAELVGNPLGRAVIGSLGVIPIARGTGDTDALDQAVEAVKAGGVLGMFPEGTRSKDGKPLRPRTGIALIAGKSGADILPCALTYEKGLRFRGRIIVRYGAVIPHDELEVNLESPSSLRGASRLIMDRIISLTGNAGEQ